jgi:diacylglycerol kinase (ATP)
MVLFNPFAGAGQSEPIARRLTQRLEHAGHDPFLQETIPQPPGDWLDRELAGVDLLLVIGGDGAVRLACGPASRNRTPIYQVPGGTENLFAREFGQSALWEDLHAAIEQFEVRWVDLGTANGELFTLMASVGYDAEVVYDVAAGRGRAITQLTYLRPMLRQLLRFAPVPMTISIDGETVVGGQSGMVIVANSRHYAFRLNPAWQASMSDGRFDVLFFPAKRAAAMVGWVLRCRYKRHIHHPRLVYQCGRSVLIECASPQRYQLDGDPPFAGGGPVQRLEMMVHGSKLPVLMGASARGPQE